MPALLSTPMVFPDLTREYILSFQFSSWYPKFSNLSIKSTVIKPLSQEFRDYLDSDGVFVPEGSENIPVESTLSDDGSAESDDESQRVSFPELDSEIRKVINEYEAVFPKLNFSSPKDAGWILPASSPLKCISPSDVYLLLKSSDFVCHDLSKVAVFEGCEDMHADQDYELELVLRKWYPVDRGRELRCFVRHDKLLGISQRDKNFYEHLNDPTTQSLIRETVQHFWETNIKGRWETGGDYIFDLLLTRDLRRGHILDFNPYAPRTDSLLFSYEELRDLHAGRSSDLPELRIIDSRTHPATSRNAPAFQHNMVPFEALSMSSGRDIEEFSNLWKEELKNSALDS